MFVLTLQTDKKAEFQEQILEHMNALYNLAYRLTQNREDACDLVQETALRGYRFYHKYEKGTNFKAWIMTVLRNIFINQYRKRVKEPNKVSYEKIEGFVNFPDVNGVQEEIFGEHVQAAVEELPEEMRAVVTLFYVEGLSYKEISGVMKCPIGTVMSRLHMARQLLKRKLKKVVEREGVL